MEALEKLGIDWWSVLLYAVNFGVVVLIIAKFLTKPLLKVLDDRTNQIRKNISEAEELRTSMAHQQEAMKKERESMQTLLQEELEKSRKDIDDKRAAAEAEIDAKKTKMLLDVQAVIQNEKAKLMSSVQADMLKLMQKIVLHIVSNKIPEDVVKQSVTESWKTYQS